ncbi:MAG: glycoside hydrolase family 97 protein [Tannerella sp.]|jgi:alpha-glucosidase|nr:glycoside hydrolase family 97 protein [Tannerella sp.]
MKRILLILMIACASLTHSEVIAENLSRDTSVVVCYSPDSIYRMTLYERDGGIYYTVDYKEHKVVLESRLGISGNIAGKAIESDASADNRALSDWYDGMRLGNYSDGIQSDGNINEVQNPVTVSAVDVAWTPVYGERSIIIDHHNAYIINILKADNPRKKLQIEVRAYKEGIAFRYIFTGNEYLHITREFTQYSLPEGSKAWFTPRAQAKYELLPLKDWKDEAERPLVCEIPTGIAHSNDVEGKLYILLTEAAMTNYARTKFVLDPTKANTITGTMYGAVDDIAPYSTPWRVIMAAEDPCELIEHNDLLLNLNPPCEIKDPSWIKPGKVMREVTLSTEGGKALVDFAVKRNLQYIHFDAGWYGPEGSKQSDATTVTLDPARNKNINALDLQEVIKYADSKGICVMLYVNQRALYQQLDEILPLYRKWGIKGVKFGFVQVGSQYWTTWMHEAVKKCAEYGLMVDIHDEYRPTGFSRTYPNLMTQEGIYGNEEFPDATNNVTLPFTRFTQGAADYTICYYRRRWDATTKPDTTLGFVNAKLLRTTPSHQLAMAVVYYSPLQFMYWYDKPSDSQDEPELEFFDRVPTVWDETRVIHGAIGQYITVARRSGDEWFIGTMTGNDARNLNIPLSFLPEGQEFTAHIYSDAEASSDTGGKALSRTQVLVRTLTVTSKTVLATPLLPSGGQAIRIEPSVRTDNITSSNTLATPIAEGKFNRFWRPAMFERRLLHLFAVTG